MKIGIISDIHANLAALRAALEALDAEACDKILCAGDVVGYGPSPLECVQIVQERRIPCVKGNHDAWVTGDARLFGVSPDARRAVEWTRSILPADALAWLDGLPMSLQYGGVEIVHAALAPRPQWAYIIHHKALLCHLLFQRSTHCFHGHTHVPMLGTHAHGARPTLGPLGDVFLDGNRRYLVNVGSVGQPRDRNPMASFAVFQTQDKMLRLVRVPYDVQETQQRMREVGLPRVLIDRLAVGE